MGARGGRGRCEGSLLPRPGLARRVLQLQVAVLLAAVAAGLGVVAWISSGSLRDVQRAEWRALLLAEASAASWHRDRGDAPGALAGGRRATGGALLAIVNDNGVILRSSGAKLPPSALDTDAAVTRTGRAWSGTLRLAAGHQLGLAGVPLRSHGRPITGSLVAGFPVVHVGAGEMRRFLDGLAALTAALVIGIAGSILVTRWLRTQTFGLELDELTNLIREQEAMFHGIQEAVVGLDGDGELQFANAEACRLLHLPSRFHHRPATVLVPPGRVQDILLGRVLGRDLVAVHEDRILVINRRSVTTADRSLGYVITLIDRTESEALLRELDGMLGLTEALRAQAHDFSNRLHAIVGLIELGAPAEAARFATDLTLSNAQLAERLTAEVGHPMLVALLLAKSAVAGERGVQFHLAPCTPISADPAFGAPTDLLTVVGNLVDNAIEAAQGCEPAIVEVRVTATEDALELEVADSGPGVPPDDLPAIFLDGYTTKRASSGARRGLGLALVSQLVRRRGGEVRVTRRLGAVFTVRLPLGPANAAIERFGDAGIVGSAIPGLAGERR